ncbi:hypothetical protein HDU98_010149, partial [Podochytrium sp. JEL0797]
MDFSDDELAAAETEETLRLQAALHFAVSKIIAQNLAANGHSGTKVTPQFIHAAASTVWLQTLTLGKDVDAFAKHAKRSVVSVDDVKLCVRRSENV